MARYLSAEWIEETDSAARACPALATAGAGLALVVQHHITDAPGGDVAYHVTVDDGDVRVGGGLAPVVDVTFTQAYATAVGIASGTSSALEAFHDGRVEVRGDIAKLRAAQSFWTVMEEALVEVRRRTSYGGS